MKKLLMLGASERHVDFIKTAKRMGLFVIVVDKDKNAPGKDFCDIFLPVSIKNIENVVLLAHEFGVDGCISIPDIGLETCATANSMLDLKGISLETYNVCRDKKLTKKLCKDASIKVADDIGYSFPIILKPVSGTGSINVVKIDNKIELNAYMYGRKQDNRKYMMEPYIQGDNVSVDLLMDKGQLKYYLIQDRYQETKRSFVDNIIISPSKWYSIAGKLARLSLKAALAVGIEYGNANVQYVITEDGTPYLIEINPRVSGPYGIECHSIATHTNWFMDTVKVILGEGDRVHNQYVIDPIKPNACITVGAEKSGVIEGWSYPLEELHAPIRWHWKHMGDYVDKLRYVKDSVKHIFITGDDVEEVKERSFKIFNKSKVITGGWSNEQ